MKKCFKKLFPRLFLLSLTFVCAVGTYGILRQSVFAADPPPDYTPLAPLPGTLACGDTCDTGSTTNLQSYLPGIFKLAIGMAGVLAVIEIIVGGLQYMSTDAIGGKQDGRQRITSAIGGLLLALGAYIILNTISPKFVTLNLNIKPDEVHTVGLPAGATGLALGASCIGAPTTPADACAEGQCLKNPLSFTDCASAVGSETGRCTLSCPTKVAHGGSCKASAQCADVADLCRIPDTSFASGCRQIQSGETGNCFDTSCK